MPERGSAPAKITTSRSRADMISVQQQLAIFASYVVVADPLLIADDVVTIRFRSPGEDAVVDSEQADHSMRHRTHRQHGADGQGAGAEVCPAGPPAERVGQQRRDLGQAQGRIACVIRGEGEITELVVRVAELPGVGRLHRRSAARSLA